MELRLPRFSGGPEDPSLGYLSIVGRREVLCFTLEDPERDEKIPGKTCIGIGRYQILLNTFGKNHDKYSKRFPDMHRGMLRLQDVPKFTGIDIHPGNKSADTKGCILVGETIDLNASGQKQVLESTKAYMKVYPIILAPLLAGEEVWIEVNHRW